MIRRGNTNSTNKNNNNNKGVEKNSQKMASDFLMGSNEV